MNRQHSKGDQKVKSLSLISEYFWGVGVIGVYTNNVIFGKTELFI